MRLNYDWAWVERQVAETTDVWNSSASRTWKDGRRYSTDEQRKREQSYDEGLLAVEQEARRTAQSEAERVQIQKRVLASFGKFSAVALDLESEAVQLLTDDFLPIGAKLARQAREFDAGLSMADIIQACRNTWTACGLQPLLGVPMAITPSIVGYSLLYPFSDNYLDQEDISTEAKLHFSRRLRSILRGRDLSAANDRETALKALVKLIEGQYPRAGYPDVFDCLLAIHQAQERSIQQLASHCDNAEILRVSSAKGGTSVLADACLVRGQLKEEEIRFAFEWGVLLQLGDDLQDVREDMRRGSATLFSSAAANGESLDGLAAQLLAFSEKVGARMDSLPNGSPTLKELLKMSWHSLIFRAVAESHEYFSPSFLEEAECSSPFGFGFLRERQRRLAGQQGLYVSLFDALLV